MFLDKAHMPIVLQADGVGLPHNGRSPAADRQLDFAARAGDLLLIEAASADGAASLGDAFSGLRPPLRGAVRFLGHDWHDLRDDEACALRGLIGRYFAHGACWVSHLSVEANVLLQQLYHTRCAPAALRTEAARLAFDFGLPGVPRDLPARMDPVDLRRAAMVRAFLGDPWLILLEEPVNDQPDLLVPVLNAAGRARERGAAVLWFTQDPAAARSVGIHSNARLHASPSGRPQVPR